MRKSSFLTFLVFVGIVQLSILQVSGQQTQSTPPRKYFRLADTLREIGNKFDCYFTIETGLVAGDHLTSIETQTVPLTIKHKKLKKALEQLRKEVPNLTYRVNEEIPKIIHIIDTRLLNQKDYAMEKILDEFSFDGVNHKMVAAIAKKGVNISVFGPLSTTDLLVVDFRTVNSVNEKNRSVREIVTKFVLLKERSRVLWTALTDLGENQVTYLRFWS